MMFNKMDLPPTVVHEDNMAVVQMLRKRVISGRARHVRTAIGYVLDVLDAGQVIVSFIGTADQLANGLTKAETNDEHAVFFSESPPPHVQQISGWKSTVSAVSEEAAPAAAAPAARRSAKLAAPAEGSEAAAAGAAAPAGASGDDAQRGLPLAPARGAPASFNSRDLHMKKVVMHATSLHPCFGSYLPSKLLGGKRVAENVAPSKQKGARMQRIIEECAQSEGVTFKYGFKISVGTLESFVPLELERWNARQSNVLKESGNGNSETDDKEYDDIIEALVESLSAQQNTNEAYKSATAAEKQRMDMAARATDMRDAGVNGMSAQNRASGPRASATARASSTGGLGDADMATWSDDSGGSEAPNAAEIYANSGLGDGGGKESAAIDKLVAVLASNADTAKESAVAQRGFDSRRLDNEDKRVEIESEKEKRLGRQLDSETARDERRDKAKIEADRVAADRAEASAQASRDMMQEMMKIMQRDRH
ncbi:hypothetical protein M885DRAFT_625419 [Pelagophyceae sp. CCMP2097]|nr:hypothetical protein M885DRAFT_625419 [Pelagophyceae sp. CCMP2097]